MLSALLYLRLTSLKNLLLTRLRRLRQPKYLFGAVVGVAYFWFLFFRRLGAGPSVVVTNVSILGLPATRGSLALLVAPLGALLLLAMITLAWVLPTEKPGLAFTEAEAAFLFPAPLSRRTLIHFKLLGSQFAILFTSLFFTLLSNRWTSLGGNTLTHAVGWWVILSTLNLHAAGAVLTLTRLIDGGVSPALRRVVVFGGMAVLFGTSFAWVWHDLSAAPAAPINGFGPFLLTFLNGGTLHWLLWPFKLVLGPFLAADASSFLLALGPALLILAALYFWVMQMNAAFEEASLGLAEKRAAAIAAWRSGKRFSVRVRPNPPGRRPPFALRGTGRPELAFLWKNLLATHAWLNGRTFRLCAVVIVVGCLWLARHPEWHTQQMMVGGGALIAGGYIMLLGPQIARQDLRSDLVNADVLKTYPLPGWQVVLGELFAPVTILSGLLWLVLLTAGLAFAPHGASAAWLTPGVRVTGGACLALVVPPLVALQLLVPNAAAVLFPGWFHSGRARGGGIDVMGQRLIFGLGQMFVLLLALLPVGLAAVVLVLAFSWLIGLPAAVVLATVAVLTVLMGEVWCGVWLIGERFEKLDLSAELRG